MKKLINKQLIQYVKQGNVLYGQKGTDFDDRYFWKNSIRNRFNELYKKKYHNPTAQAMDEAFNKFLTENFATYNNYYYNINKGPGVEYQKRMKLEDSMKAVTGLEGYFRDKNGQLWIYKKKGTEDPNKEFFESYKKNNYYYEKVDQDIRDHKTHIPAKINTAKPVSGKPTEKPVNTEAEANEIYEKVKKEAGIVDTPEGGPEVSEFDPNVTDKKELFDPNITDKRELEESIIHKPTVAPQRQNSSYRLIKRTTPVARPEKMPMMNRSDVRYTLNDITTQSPYFTSDTELVNSLAGTPNDNMFKQALMNRLGMDKWDNTTALNRLNFLGIKGHIGGSDRKRLRNLINKGTTSNGEIRK